MRDYGKVAPTFWTGETGIKLRGFGRDAQLLALYLISGPNANWIGLYHLPMVLIYHHLGLTKEGASKALARVIRSGFAFYDGASEVVFVVEMAAHQIGQRLKPTDKRHKGVCKDLEIWRKSIYIKHFYARYELPYHLPKLSPLEGASQVGLPEAEQEQEQEQEAEADIKPRSRPKKFTPPTIDQVTAYCQERGNTVDASTFIDHYAANGWMRGKSKVVDWRACVRTWEKNQNGKSLAGQPLTDEDLSDWNPVTGGGE